MTPRAKTHHPSATGYQPSAISHQPPVTAVPSASDGAWLLDVLGVPFGGPYGGRDAHGEYFTDSTDLWLERIARRPVVYYHGLAEGPDAPPQLIGEELGWERRADGIWFRVALDPANVLAQRVWEAAQKGLARASSGAIAHLVRVAKDGRIVVWPIGEISLLDAREHAPANPYAVAIPAEGVSSIAPYRVEAMRAKTVFAAAGLNGAEVFTTEAPTSAGAPSNKLTRRAGPAGSPQPTQHKEDLMTLDEQTVRNIMRQEIGAAMEDFVAGDVSPNAMFLTRTAPAVISQRGEPLLSANGTPFVDAIKAMRQGRFDVVRFQLAGKALGEGTDSAGGYLVPVEHSNKLIEMLRSRTAVRAAGATVIPMSSDVLQIPSQTGGATAYWVAENAQITASDQTWGQVQLQAKKLAALTKLSAELFEDSDPQVEALVMADLARVLALEEDLKYLRGNGAGNTPTGLESIGGINVDTTTLGANGAAPTFDNLVNMLYNLDADSVPAEGRAWIVHPRTVNSLRKVKDSQNKYLWADPGAPGDPPTLWGYPVFTSAYALHPQSHYH